MEVEPDQVPLVDVPLVRASVKLPDETPDSFGILTEEEFLLKVTRAELAPTLSVIGTLIETVPFSRVEVGETEIEFTFITGACVSAGIKVVIVNAEEVFVNPEVSVATK